MFISELDLIICDYCI